MRKLRLGSHGSDDPLDGMANLFDLGIVFALGFGIAILARVSTHTAAPDPTKQTPQQAEPVPTDASSLEHYRSTNESLGGNGTRLGTAYRLANGDVVYVPEAPGGSGR